VDKFFRLALVVIATARLIRFVTEDSLGYWWVVEPVRAWANVHDNPDIERGSMGSYEEPQPWRGWRSKVASGIDCRWCVGFWIGVLVLVGEVTLGRIPGVRHLWTFALAALALNSVANGVGKGIHTLS
jgi:hypothetical protein